jgi:SPASM domain peptide maturase of grasp-with-spasm system
LDFIYSILTTIHNFQFSSIELIINHNYAFNKTDYLSRFEKFGKLKYVMVFNFEFDEYIESKRENNMGNFIFLKQRNIDCNSCGKIDHNYFTVNSAFYRESLAFNSCLNKKISLDENGNIKNCPSMSAGYGSIKEVKLIDVIENKSFNRFWNITKRDIKTCKVCEFRDICSDCRVFLEDENDILSKPLKCNYNPYKPLQN